METFVASDTRLTDRNNTPIEGVCNRKTVRFFPLKTVAAAVLLLSITAVKAQCGFTITPEAAEPGCVKTEETAVWVNTANAEVVGETISKSDGGNNWNSGGESSTSFSDFGYAETVVVENNFEKAFGLNHDGSSYHPNSLPYAFFLRYGADLRVIEGGADRGSVGNYAVGDTLRISIKNEIVTFLKNGEVLHVSNASPEFPLRAKGLMRHPSAVLGHVRIGRLSSGLITASSTAGNGPSYQWRVNGLPAGFDNDSLNAASLEPGDLVTCFVTTTDGCETSGVESNTVRILPTAAFAPANFFISSTAAVSACHAATEAVKFSTSSGRNVNITENRVEKIQGGTNWNAGASSLNRVYNNGSFSFTTEENNTQKAAGLSHIDANPHPNSVDFAFRLEANGSLRIFESGNNRGTFGSYEAGDVFEISIENDMVYFYRNGELLRVSNNTPELPLVADVSMRSEGATITQAEIRNLNDGNFTAFVQNAGPSPVYQWKVNGVDTGIDGPTFSETDLVSGDVITCDVTPDLESCGETVTTSNAISIAAELQPAAINFYISSQAVGSACNVAEEAVQWNQSTLANAAPAGNRLEKIQGGTNWNAGASSLNQVHDNGSFRFTTEENNRQKAAGLSNTDGGTHVNSIDYGFLMHANGSFRIYESGNNRGTFGSYSEGDQFEISVKNGAVHYYRNDELLRVSTVSPDLPLIADISLRSEGATIGKAFIANLNDGTFLANAENIGVNPLFQWKVNGVATGDNNPVFSEPGLGDGDIVTCELTPDIGGCSEVTYFSNDIEKTELPAPPPINFYIRGEVSQAACYSVEEEVQWNSNASVNVAISGNSFEKIQGGTNWNANASSLNRVFNNGRLRFTPNEANRQKAMGLSHEDMSNHLNSIQYAFLMQANGSLRIIESGNNRGTFGNFNSGDTLEIAVDNGTVKYFHNSELLYISGNTPELPLLADASIREVGGSIGKVLISNFNDGTFAANAENAGDNPVFQWYLNGAQVGGNSAVYTNPQPDNGDVISCTLSPDLGGCSNVIYASNAAETNIETVADETAFYSEGTVDQNGFGYAAEEVVWNPGSLLNTEVDGNDLIKVQSNNNWNGAGVSFNSVKNEGYFEFTASETNRRRAVGLSSSNTGSHVNNIQFAFYLDRNGSLRIFESGNNRGTFGTYASGDVLRIGVEAAEVKYYRNGTLVRTSTLTPTLPLIAHASIYTNGGTVTNALIANKSGGGFSANAGDAGENPVYSWKLNGTAVGDGTAEYYNPNVKDGDIITCDITPDFQGCGNAEYASNNITVYGPQGTTNWTGTVSSTWSDAGNWSNGVPDQHLSAVIPAGTLHLPVVISLSQVNELTIDPGATLQIGGNNTLQVYGDLSNGGIFDPGQGTLVFAGPGSRTLSGNQMITYRTIANLENPSDSIIMDVNVVVNEEMLLLQGVIVTGNHELIYRSGAESRFGSENAYVDGVVRKSGVEAFVFPVGRGGAYAPVAISAPAAQSEFTAEYFDGDPDDAGYSTDEIDETLTNVGRCEYWMINREFGTSAVSVTLSYGNEQSCGVEDPAQLKVARWNGNRWQDHGYLIHDGDSNSGTVTSGSAIAQFSPFTIGSGSGINPLPVSLIDFTAKAEGKNVRLTWTTASEINNDYFTLERSRDGINFRHVATVSGAGNSNTLLHYSHTDQDPYAGTSYYRLTQTDFDGRFETFPIQSVRITESAAFDIFPNPTDGQITIRLSQAEGGAQIRVLNTAGQIVHAENTTTVQHRMDLSQLSKGAYVVHITSGQAVFNKKLVIR